MIAGLDPVLLDLVSLRVSQINGCGFCLDMQTKELRAKGVSEQVPYLLSLRREVPSLYSSREKAALAWAEVLTKLGEHGVLDDVFDTARGLKTRQVRPSAMRRFATICASASITCPVRR
ncbi:MAG TPA: carboxymuconolactone decarboxylase family protein [Parvibaculum sp.]